MASLDGKAAIGLGISTISGGNVVSMGQALQIRMAELQEEIPLGIEFGIVSMQSESVVEAINGFVVSLAQAVVIVILVLLVFMGFRSAVPYEKVPAGRRVLFLGDSYTEGSGRSAECNSPEVAVSTPVLKGGSGKFCADHPGKSIQHTT